jgi:hypothetical protein
MPGTGCSKPHSQAIGLVGLPSTLAGRNESTLPRRLSDA